MELPKMWYQNILPCLSTVAVVFGESIHGEHGESGFSYTDFGDVSWVMAVGIACVGLLLTVFVVALCGGCTPMEVSSDGHEAVGGHKSGNNGHYDSVATDVNTHVMSAGTTLPHDPHQHNDQSLPYALHPQGVQTANAFTGYQQHSQGTGYTGPSTGNQTRPGAHIPATGGSEPPPPNYYEATASAGNQRPSAPAQAYGW